MWVIPAIDLVEGKCVRLYQGDYSKQTTYAEDPAAQALRFQAARFRRLHVIDLEGARSGSGANRRAIEAIMQTVRIPVQVGGGIRTGEDVQELLSMGVQYLILGTVALKDPERVSQWVERWGPDPFVISLDLKQGKLVSEGWLEQTPVGLDEALSRIQGWGVRQVISTDVEKDGTLDQPNYATYELLRARLPGRVALIAAGGVCRPEHLRQLREIGVGGAVVGKALYEGGVSWEELVHAG